ncbi:hypothetical protein ACS7SF_26595 (plasmid) [Ralstonia sp. 25C]|uniref:hypothetical protein n=1 Tax=Ralstonia sp. 25C TaxID=3447363 RepID=UPI003F74FF63
MKSLALLARGKHEASSNAMVIARTSAIIARLKWAWVAWGVVTAGLAMYCTIASVASTGVRAEVVLAPGRTARLPVTSLYGHALSFELDFARYTGGTRDTDLGSWTRTEDGPGTLRFSTPGARVAGTVSVNSGTPIPLETMPANGYGANVIFRDFSESLPVAPGEWRWPPNSAKAHATPGHNDVVVTITDVAPALTGETVELWARPPLSFNATAPHYGWLWPAYLLRPLGVPLVAGTGLFLLYLTWRARRTAHRHLQG